MDPIGQHLKNSRNQIICSVRLCMVLTNLVTMTTNYMITIIIMTTNYITITTNYIHIIVKLN